MDERIKDKNADPERGKPTESALEEGLEGTFPASDPVSSTSPGKPGNDDTPETRR